MVKPHPLILIAMTALILNITESSAQSVERGTVIIDPYYGFSLSAKKFSNWVTEDTETKISGLGPLGGRVEYMVTNRLGVGLIYNYNTANVKWNGPDSTGTIIDSTGTMFLTNMMVNVNIHLAASSDVFDLYASIATGTAFRKGTRSADSPNAIDQNINWSGFGLPFGIRGALGGRYYFTNNLGVNGELGVGTGPVISIGISVKL